MKDTIIYIISFILLFIICLMYANIASAEPRIYTNMQLARVSQQALPNISDIKDRIGFFKWKTQDQILFSMFTGMQAVDLLQTGRYQESQYLCEGNILLAKRDGSCNPNMALVAGVKTGFVGLTYWMTNTFPGNQTFILLLMNIGQFWVINHNRKVLNKYEMSGIAGLKINLAQIGFKF